MIPLRDKNPSGTFPTVTVLIILANVGAFFFELRLGARGLEGLFQLCGVVPLRAKAALAGHPAQGVVFGVSVFTSMFLHGGWMHLIGNMWYLWIFGDNVEDRLGHWKFMAFYLLCGVLAALAHTIFHLNSQVPTVGASGAIAGVLGAYLVLYPRARILTLVPIFFFITFVNLPAVFVLGAWFVIQLLNHTLTLGAATAVAWMAHIGGFLAGMLLIRLFPCRHGFRRSRSVR